MTVLLYMLVGCLLLLSSSFLFLKVVAALMLLWQILPVIEFKKPHLDINEIKYMNQNWICSGKNAVQYVRLKGLINTGFFQLLLLRTEEGKTKTLIVFKDQLTQSEYHQLQFWCLRGEQLKPS